MFKRHLTIGKLRTGAAPVYLNVYDLTPINSYAYWFGLGVYHSGVQVHGVEYAYGAHDHSTTGIFEAEPRSCAGFAFRKSILIGRTDLGPSEVRTLMDELSLRYTGNTYNLISKNCNHFCNDACLRLAGNATPRWVNRLAKLGFLCKCVLPANLAVVSSRTEDGKGGGELRRLRSRSALFGGDRDDGPAPPLMAGNRSSSRRSRRASPSPATSGGEVYLVKSVIVDDI